MKKRNRYTIENLPLSQKTKDGLEKNSLIDGLKVIELLLSTQDEVYDDQFHELKTLLKLQNETVNALVISVNQMQRDVTELSKTVNELRSEVRDLTKVVDETRKKVNDLENEVMKLKSKNTFKAMAIRIILAITSALVAFRLWHGPM
jgi:predicted  nucleic acid-binding Zn-ribbon protein